MSDERKRVCIIGSGASGLVSMKVAQEENLDIVCYERSDFIGGLWKYRDEDDPRLASVTRSTIINSSKEMSAFSDFPPPAEFPNYMHNSLMHEYFELYAKNFNLKRYIKFKHEILSVKQAKDFDATGCWNVTVKNLETDQITDERFDAVMICSGHHVKPLKANFKGQEKFKGKILHTHSYKTPHPFDGDRCLVIGIGNSGGDAAVELSMVAKKVYLSTRRGAWVLWRVGPGGLPFDAMYIRRFWFRLLFTFPYALVCFVIQTYLNLRFNHKAYGVQPDHQVLSQHPMVNDALPNRILSGTVKVKGDIQEFTENGVIFKGENEVTEIDTCILATGYDTEFKYLDKDLIDPSHNEVRLYKYVYHPDLSHPETLGFIGLVQVFGPAIPVSEMQARWFIQTLVKKAKPLPDKETMYKDIAKKRKEIDERYFRGARHTIQVDWVPYMDEISSLFGAKPDLFKIFLTDLPFFFKLYFGPCLPYQYRVNGPNKWKGAKEAIYTYDDRVICALKTRRTNEDDQDLGIFDSVYQHLVKFFRDTLHFNNVFVLLIVGLFVLLFWFYAK